jgi:hypothetical protein
MVLRRIHALAALVFVGAIVVQVLLAGLAIRELGGSGNFAAHAFFGFTWMGLLALAVVVTAFLARMPRRDIVITIGLLLLYFVQTSLPAASSSFPVIAALHPLNAMVLFVLAIWYARHAWRVASSATPQPASASPAIGQPDEA